jgi:hypothetical protein
MRNIRNQARRSRACHTDDRVMALWDEGLTVRQIAERLQVTESRIRTVVSAMSVGPADRWRRLQAFASATLAARILEVHGVMA